MVEGRHAGRQAGREATAGNEVLLAQRSTDGLERVVCLAGRAERLQVAHRRRDWRLNAKTSTQKVHSSESTLEEFTVKSRTEVISRTHIAATWRRTIWHRS